jgi:LPXTG-motif cell wall-anchored protein
MSIPDGVTKLPAGVLSGCSGLTDFTIADTVTSIGEYAFKGCSGLTTLVIPNSVTSIGDGIVMDCTKLTSVQLPGSITSYPDQMFSGCTSLKTIALAEGATSVPTKMFYGCTNLEEVILPSTITSIGSYAFSGCSKLTNINIPDSVNTIGAYAFNACSKLTSIVIPEGVKTINNRTFQSCYALNSVQLPSTLTSIGEYAFYGCSSLKRITIPEGVTNINDKAFYSSGLVNVVLPSTVTSIGTEAFRGCASLEQVEILGNVTTIPNSAFRNCYSLKSVVLPETVKTLDTYAFYECSNLREIEIPANITTINSYALSGCSRLETIVWNATGDNNVTINTTAFANTTSITKVVIGSNVNSLTKDTLNQLTKNSVKPVSIAFQGPNKFTYSGDSITIDNVVLTAGDYYVDADGTLYRLGENNTATLVRVSDTVSEDQYQQKMTGFTVDDTAYTVTEIGSYAFHDFTSLESITIPSNITKVHAFAFDGCIHLASVNGETTLEEAYYSLPSGSPIGALWNTALWNSRSEEGDNGLFTVEGRNLSFEKHLTGDDYRVQIDVAVNDTDLVVLDDGTTSDNTLYTGATATITVSLDQTQNGMTDSPRVYFQLSDGASAADLENDKIFGYKVGQELVFTANGRTVKAKFCDTDDPYLYYLEFYDCDNGATAAPVLSITYPLYTDGGSMICWIDPTSEGTVMPKEVSQVNWITVRDEFHVTETASSSTVSAKGNGEEDSPVTLRNLIYMISTIRDTNKSQYGKDPMELLTYSSVLELPQEVSWRSGVLEAIQNGNWYTKVNSGYQYLYVTIDGADYELCHLQVNSGTYTNLRDLTPSVQDGKVVLDWNWTNTSNQEMSNAGLYLYYGNEVLVVDMDQISAEMEANGTTSVALSFTNTTDTTQTFRFSEDEVEQQVSATKVANIGLADFTFSKSLSETGQSSGGTYYMGANVSWYLKWENTSAYPVANLTTAEDTLDTMYWIKPANMEAMLNGTQGKNLTITITGMQICRPVSEEVTNVKDKTYTINGTELAGMLSTYGSWTTTDPCIKSTKSNATITIKWADSGDYWIMSVQYADGTSANYEIGTGKAYASIESALNAIGATVVTGTTYKVEWDVSDVTLYSGETMTIPLYSSVKSSFQYLAKDNRYYSGVTSKYAINNAFAWYGNNGSSYKSAYNYCYIYYDYYLSKGVTKDGAAIDENTEIKAGDIVTYQTSVSRYGYRGSAYYALPLVDEMTGGEVLLVKATENPQLKKEGLDTQVVNGVTYYILNRSGTYEDVMVGGYMADKITVDISSTDKVTRIYWYLDTVNQSSYAFTYLAKIDPSGFEKDEEDTDGSSTYRLSNWVWLGDHSSHRLYDNCYFDGTDLHMDKSILTNFDGVDIDSSHDPSQDELDADDFTYFYAGNEVKYRLTISSIGDADDYYLDMYGTALTDFLPQSVDNYWNTSNVSIAYVLQPDEGGKGELTGEDSWYIEDGDTVDSKGNAVHTTQQSIQWTKNFHLQLKGTLYIYVTLTLPEAGTTAWNDYATYYGATVLKNTFQVYKIQDSVTHLLAVESQGSLHKGVYMTSSIPGLDIGSYVNGGWGQKRTVNTDSNARNYYTNNTTSYPIVTYYASVYNSGKSRLYITEIQDVLPKGFTFAGLMSSTDRVYLADGSSTTTTTSSGKIMRVTESNGWNNGYRTIVSTDGTSVQQVSAYIKATATVNDSGRTVIKFVPANGGTAQTIGYDENLGMFYLNPGEVLTIIYDCYTNGYSDSEDEATNVAAFRGYDYTGAGFSFYDTVHFTPSNYTSVFTNDGEAEEATNDQVLLWGMNASTDSSTVWLASNASVYRGRMKPGIQKTCDVTQATAVEPINWTVTVTNDGSEALRGYIITDVMMSPYTFEGDITYRMYTAKNSPVQSSAVTLVPAAMIPDVGEEVTVSGTFGDVTVKQTLDADGNHVLTFYFPDETKGAIPAGGFAELKLTTNNDTSVKSNKDFINQSYVTPTKQSFSKSDVHQGQYLMYTTAGATKAMASVASEARVPVSYGYATTSNKSVTELTSSTDLTTTTNKASANDINNYIVLSNGMDSIFRYTMEVNNIGSSGGVASGMSLFVLVDNLPEENDHTTFYSNYERYSDFKVDFATADKLDLTVTTTLNGSTTTLTPDQYTVLFSTQTTLDYGTDTEALWQGEDNVDGWYTLEECASHGGLQAMRSVRVVITDPNCEANLLPGKVTIKVSFNAVIDSNEQPDYSDIAWNSFGYFYQIGNLQLQAAPEKVGIKIAGVPYIVKNLRGPDGNDYEAEQDETFRFLLYKGTNQNLDASGSLEDWAKALSEKNIDFTVVDLTVLEGETSSEELALDNQKVYTYDAETNTVSEGTTNWTWVEDAYYTMMEEIPGEDRVYDLYTLGDAPPHQSYFTFSFDSSDSPVYQMVNQRQSWSLNLVKRDAVTNSTLQGAVFAIYSRAEDTAMTVTDADLATYGLSEAPDATKELADVDLFPDASGDEAETEPESPGDTEVGDDGEVEAEEEVETETWRLVGLAMTDSNGTLQFSGLVGDEYYLFEVKPPEGYVVNDEEGQVVTNTTGEDITVTVENALSVTMPVTGGIGTQWLTYAGTALLLVSGVVCYKRGKRRGRSTR